MIVSRMLKSSDVPIGTNTPEVLITERQVARQSSQPQRRRELDDRPDDDDRDSQRNDRAARTHERLGTSRRTPRGLREALDGEVFDVQCCVDADAERRNTDFAHSRVQDVGAMGGAVEQRLIGVLDVPVEGNVLGGQLRQ